MHDVLTVIPHYAAFFYSVGTELGAPAALGLLLEAVRAALNSPTATLSLGNVAAAAELYKYLAAAYPADFNYYLARSIQSLITSPLSASRLRLLCEIARLLPRMQ